MLMRTGYHGTLVGIFLSLVASRRSASLSRESVRSAAARVLHPVPTMSASRCTLRWSSRPLRASWRRDGGMPSARSATPTSARGSGSPAAARVRARAPQRSAPTAESPWPASAPRRLPRPRCGRPRSAGPAGGGRRSSVWRGGSGAWRRSGDGRSGYRLRRRRARTRFRGRPPAEGLLPPLPMLTPPPLPWLPLPSAPLVLPLGLSLAMPQSKPPLFSLLLA
mmetsp:Transcript_82681/g.267687  ORF Transcript_82681/g.267687 Transcript_82681/m.267687 type:complete len:222 (+) Transcript_82681:265-930(+)